MPKAEIPYEDFLAMVPPQQLAMVKGLDKRLRAGGCGVSIQPAKSGYVVSYRFTATGRVVANFVFRKKGIFIRIYAENVLRYMDVLESLPPALKAKVAKAPLCKRLASPDKCSPHCPKGYEFIMDGESHQKCRYNCFLFLLDEKTTPAADAILEKDLACRAAA